MVGQLFTESGCDVEISKIVKLVRGSKEIDVYVEDNTVTPKTRILCECKFWKKAVPQEIVHSFRTVVSDFGAHHGFIITMVGFQSGCVEAIQNTNIELITFELLQEIYFDKWISSIAAQYMRYADRLFPYWDYVGKMPKIKWSEKGFEHQQLLYKAYAPLCSLGPGDDLMGFRRKFPIELPVVNAFFEKENTFTINSYREYFDFCERNKDRSFWHFQLLFGEISANEYKENVLNQ
ncbi:MAG: restriction endonuclease [Chitinophagaceae bacterium]|nr:restriction endonuclease [Anaerolineae bacterium]